MKPLLCFLVIGLSWPQPGRAADSQVGGRTSPDGKEEIVVDLPGAEHMKNVGGKDGAGLCVFTSIEHAAHWQNVEVLRGFQQKMRAELGGGWPEKVDAMLRKYAPDVPYVQYTGSDPSILKLALRTGRMPGVTYGYSPRYGGKIAHMVNLAHLSDRWACVLDNNFPGESQYEWMTTEEFYRRWKMGGSGWAVVLLHPPPPPIPVNGDATPAAAGNGSISSSPYYCGQCPGGACGPVRIAPTPAVVPVFAQPAPVWYSYPDRPGRFYLYQNGLQIGAYYAADKQYFPYHAATEQWGDACAPPIALPATAQPKCPCGSGCTCGSNCTCKQTGQRCGEECSCVPAVADFGVEWNRSPLLRAGETHYAINGRKVEAHEALRAVQASGTGLIDDTARPRLTVIGSADECRRVTDDLAHHPALAAWKDRLLVQAYRPEAWAIHGVNLPAGGHPTIVVQAAPDAHGRGRVLHVQHDYADGPEGLSGALRNADAGYDPHRDPDRRPRPEPAPTVEQPPQRHWLALGILGALLVLILVGRRTRS